MSTDELPRFDEGDVIEIRGHRYAVQQVDAADADDRVDQYQLEPLGDAPQALLKPRPTDGVFIGQVFHTLDADEIEFETDDE